MKIAIMGAGGVGGYYGGRLAAAGHDVHFIARGPHLQALQQGGLRVQSPLGTIALPTVHATEDPGAIGPVELVLFTTKAYDLAAAAETLRPLMGADTVVIPLLNGVDIAEQLAAVLGEQAVLGGLCYISSAISEPGVITHAGPMERLVFGERQGGSSPRVQALLELLKAASIGAELSESIAVEVWNKFLFLCAIAGVCAVTRCTIGPILATPESKALMLDCLREIESVARALGVPLKPEAAQATLHFMEGLGAGTKPSLLLALEQGKPLELDVLSGAVLRLGAQAGVATPINGFIHAALKPYAQGAPAQ